MLELGKKETTLSKNEFLLKKIDESLCLDLNLNRTAIYNNGKPSKVDIMLDNALVEIYNDLSVIIKGHKSFYINGESVQKEIKKHKDLLGDELISYKDENGFVFYNNSHGATLIKYINYDDFYKLLETVAEVEKDMRKCRESLDKLILKKNKILN